MKSPKSSHPKSIGPCIAKFLFVPRLKGGSAQSGKKAPLKVSLRSVLIPWAKNLQESS